MDGKRAAEEALVDLTQDSDDDAQLLPASAKKTGAAAPAGPPRKPGVVVGSGTPMLTSLLAAVRQTRRRCWPPRRAAAISAELPRCWPVWRARGYTYIHMYRGVTYRAHTSTAFLDPRAHRYPPPPGRNATRLRASCAPSTPSSARSFLRARRGRPTPTPRRRSSWSSWSSRSSSSSCCCS